MKNEGVKLDDIRCCFTSVNQTRIYVINNNSISIVCYLYIRGVSRK